MRRHWVLGHRLKLKTSLTLILPQISVRMCHGVGVDRVERDGALGIVQIKWAIRAFFGLLLTLNSGAAFGDKLEEGGDN